MNVAQTGEYTLRVLDTENIPASIEIYLKDSQTGQAVLFNESGNEYDFLINNEGTIDDRFSLEFTSSSVGAAEVVPEADFRIHANREYISVSSLNPDSKTFTIELFNMTGQLLMTRENEGDSIVYIKSPSTGGIYLVSIRSNTYLFTRKIIIN